MFDLLLNASCFPSLPSQTVLVLVGTVSHISAVFPVVKLPSVLDYVWSQFVRAHLEAAEPSSSAHSRQALPLVPIPAPLPIAFHTWDSFPVLDQNCCPHLLVMWITPLVTQCSQSEASRPAGAVAAAQLSDLSSQWQLHLGAHLFAVQILQVVKPQTKCPSLFFSWGTDVKHCKQLRQWPERAGVDVINWLEWVLCKNFLVQKIKSQNILLPVIVSLKCIISPPFTSSYYKLKTCLLWFTHSSFHLWCRQQSYFFLISKRRRI